MNTEINELEKQIESWKTDPFPLFISRERWKTVCVLLLCSLIVSWILFLSYITIQKG